MVRSRGLAIGGLVVALVVPAGLAGCRAIAGYRDLGYAPASTTCSAPSLPATGNGRIRLANAGTKAPIVDFCVRASGTSDWGQPVLAEAGPNCRVGLGYAQVTVPFAAPVGRIDVEAIAPGSTCDAAAMARVSGIPVGDSTNGAPVVTIVHLGGGANAERIVGLPEEPASTAESEARLRVVNALSGGGTINVGVTSSDALPATVAQPGLPQGIVVGGVEPAGQTNLGNADTSGYLSVIALGLHFGAIFDGETSALFVIMTPQTSATETVFAIGDPGDPAHPVRGLLCEELGSAGPPAAMDAGAPGEGSADAGALAAGSPLLASCALTDLPSIAVDTFKVALYGAASPYENERRQAIYDAVAARTTDLMCLTEIDSQTDKQNVAAAANVRFPYAYFPDPPKDLDTQANDPAELDGGLPAPASAPPCGSGVSSADVDAIYSCVAQSCSTTGDMTGVVAGSANCLSQACLIPLASLYEHGEQQDSCFDCILYYLTSGETLAYGQSACTTDIRQPFAFTGQTTAMLLSHYPLSNQQTLVLPSTGWRRAVLYAQVQLEDQAIDFYCGGLTSPLNDVRLPYTGNYGKDGTTNLPDGGEQVENGWEDEQGVQVARLVAFIQQTSGSTGRPAILAGDWQSTLGVTDPGGNVVLGDLSPGVASALDRAFTRAEPAGYVPRCTGNGDTPADGFMRTIVDGAAEYERALIRARTRAALQAKRARGERVGSIAYGFTLAPDGVHLVALEQEQRTIARARRLARAGRSLRSIAAALARAGHVSRAGRPFFAAQIDRMLAGFERCTG